MYRKHLEQCLVRVGPSVITYWISEGITYKASGGGEGTQRGWGRPMGLWVISLAQETWLPH